jgi:hypothetical protein
MNTLLNGMKQATNWALTENGGITHKTTNSDLLDMFAMGAAMRNRSDADVILMFQKAFDENAELAMKMLFYIRDVRGGQGERRFFRTVVRWAATNKNTRESIRKNIEFFPEFGRWDDLYALCDTPLEQDMFTFMKKQLALDVECKTPSLLAKWMKSENASSPETKRLADKTRRYLGMSHKEYRKVLSIMRARINVLEVLMSANRWDEIEFDKIPSKAGLIYKNAFARRDIIKAKYEKFAKDENTKVNAATLYPYEVVEKAIDLMGGYYGYGRGIALDNTDRLMINKYWDNLTDYFKGAKLDALCMIDTSGSMSGTPINVATALGMYCAERNQGPWHNHYISFSHHPQLIEVEGVDFCDKVQRIVATNLCQNTNIEAAFDMVLNTAIRTHAELPEYMIVISDMEFDSATGNGWRYSGSGMTTANAESTMETIERKFNAAGYRMPKLIYWNVDARQANIPMIGNHYVSYVSGFSPSIFKSILTGKTGWDLMMEAIDCERYACIHA